MRRITLGISAFGIVAIIAAFPATPGDAGNLPSPAAPLMNNAGMAQRGFNQLQQPIPYGLPSQQQPGGYTPAPTPGRCAPGCTQSLDGRTCECKFN
jgi:hypothetical protein